MAQKTNGHHSEMWKHEPWGKSWNSDLLLLSPHLQCLKKRKEHLKHASLNILISSASVWLFALLCSDEVPHQNYITIINKIKVHFFINFFFLSYLCLNALALKSTGCSRWVFRGNTADFYVLWILQEQYNMILTIIKRY